MSQAAYLACDFSGIQRLISLHGHWRAVRDQTKDNGRTAGQETLLELLANAERRAKQSRFDDAVGRLYRAVELRGQQLVKQAFGAELGRVALERFPASRRNDVLDKLGEPRCGAYKLGVQNLFQALEFGEDEDLCAQARIYDCLCNHLSNRNSSLLAHGLQPVAKERFESFWEAALPALGLCDADIPRWPQLELKLG